MTLKNSCLIAMIPLLTSSTAFASQELAKTKNCMACHSVATKLVGPSYKDIAAKYAENPAAEAMLTQKVRKGSTGVWGPLSMPPNAHVNEEEGRVIVKWILTIK